jgi:Tol biopolymer transport system component
MEFDQQDYPLSDVARPSKYVLRVGKLGERRAKSVSEAPAQYKTKTRDHGSRSHSHAKQVWFLVLALFHASFLCAQERIASEVRPGSLTAAPPTGFVRFTNTAFAFDRPVSWRAMRESEIAVFRQEYENQSREQFRLLYGRVEGYDWGVAPVSGYLSPDADISFIALVLKVPPESKGAIESAWERSRDVIEYGKRSGRLKNVLKHEKTEISHLPALESDFEMGDGSRMVGAAIEAAPGAIVQMHFICKPGAYTKHEKEIDQVMKRFTVFHAGTAPSRGEASRSMETLLNVERLGVVHRALSVTRSATPEGCHLAMVINDATGGTVMVLDGEASPKYDKVGQSGVVFSPDGRRLAYAALKNGRWFAVVDGKAGTEYDQVGALVFSPDGRRVAYGAKKGDKWLMAVDGQVGPECEAIGSPVFSPDSKRVAYGARKGISWFVVVDGQPEPGYDAIIEGSWVFSSNGKRVAYAAVKNGRWFAVVDGKAGTEYDLIGALVFSPDEKRVAYAAAKDNKWLVVVDSQAGQEFDQAAKGKLLFSSDGKRVAYDAKRGDKCFVVVDGQAGPECDGLGSPMFSPDSKRVAYGAQKGDKWFLAVERQFGPECDGLGKNSPIFSPDGKRVAYAARKGNKWSVFMDGQPGPVCDAIAMLGFSPNGKRIAYAAQKGRKWLVILDGQPGPEYDRIGENTLVFSPDSLGLAYAAVDGGKWSVVLGGHAGPDYDGLACGPIFRRDGALEYLARKQDTLYRVTVNP